MELKMRRILIPLIVTFLFAIASLNLHTVTADTTAQQAKHTAIKIDPKTFDPYVGQYRSEDNPDFVLSFWREGDKFFSQATSQSKFEILAESQTTFFPKDFDASVTFVGDAQAHVTALVLRQNDQELRFKKISNQPAIEVNVPFERREEMIPMRDGVRLHTLIFAPKNQTESLPIIFSRTPYGIGQANSDTINGRYNDLVKDGYIFVLQDIRGRYGSEGQFMMNRPLHDKNDPKGIDESTDTYDTIDWLIKNVGNNDNVGILGVSYDGWLAAVATVDAHPSYDDYWKARGSGNYLKPTTVATLVVGGWWDQEDYYGALQTYNTLEKFDKKHQNFLVLGPWNHGGWNGRGRNLGAVNFGTSTGPYFRAHIQAPWFAYYLKGKGKPTEPEAMTFETGCNQWKSFDHWSPKESAPRDLFLHEGKKLSFEKSSSNDAAETYISDPANPVPYRKRPIEATYDPKGSAWYTWLVQDQRSIQGRNDVVSWQSDRLDKDLVIAGDVVAHLFAATSGTDSDWVVKLIDVYPDAASEKNMAGYQLMVADEIFRGRYLKGFEKPSPIVAGQVNEYSIDLHSADHCFKKGHRLMVQVQSTWFPLYDRNPQKFVGNIFQARPEDYQSATQRIFESARYPSRLTLPVIRQ